MWSSIRRVAGRGSSSPLKPNPLRTRPKAPSAKVPSLSGDFVTGSAAGGKAELEGFAAFMFRCWSGCGFDPGQRFCGRWGRISAWTGSAGWGSPQGFYGLFMPTPANSPRIFTNRRALDAPGRSASDVSLEPCPSAGKFVGECHDAGVFRCLSAAATARRWALMPSIRAPAPTPKAREDRCHA